MVRSRYGFDEAKIARFQKEGRGKGRGRDYLPWLKIGDVPSRGRSSRLKGNTTARVHHFLSDIERDLFHLYLFHLFDWDDSVEDVREQFPLDRDATRRIADALGIEHSGCRSASLRPQTDPGSGLARKGRDHSRRPPPSGHFPGWSPATECRMARWDGLPSAPRHRKSRRWPLGAPGDAGHTKTP